MGLISQPESCTGLTSPGIPSSGFCSLWSPRGSSGRTKLVTTGTSGPESTTRSPRKGRMSSITSTEPRNYSNFRKSSRSAYRVVKSEILARTIRMNNKIKRVLSINTFKEVVKIIIVNLLRFILASSFDAFEGTVEYIQLASCSFLVFLYSALTISSLVTFRSSQFN